MQTLPWECLVAISGWQWRHYMHRHCEMHHPNFLVTDGRVVTWNWEPGEVGSFDKGGVVLWGAKRKSGCTDMGTRAKCKKLWQSVSAALHSMGEDSKGKRQRVRVKS